MKSEPEAARTRWPATRFYWALLDASILPRSARRDPTRLGFLLEPLLPCALDEVHAIYHGVADGRVLACAADRVELGVECERGTIELTPEALPPFLDVDMDPGELNLLTGSFEPPTVRELRVKSGRTLLAALLVGLLLVALGLEQRGRAVRDQFASLTRVEGDLVTGVLGPDALRSPVPLSLQLEAELRSLRQTRSASPQVAALPDAGLALEELLALWPADLHVETDSIHVTPESIHVQCRLSSTDDAQELATALSSIEGWTGVTPTIRAQADAVRAAIQLRRRETQ